MKYLSVYDVAKAKGAKESEDGSMSGAEFERLGLPMIGGCLHCQATIAAYNGYPTSTGFLMCKGCVEGSETGFKTIEEYNAWESLQDGRGYPVDDFDADSLDQEEDDN